MFNLLLPVFALLTSLVISSTAHTNGNFNLQSPSFKSQSTIPTLYTCKGQDKSPPLSWGSVPQNTKSLVLIMDDPDAPGGTWYHWVIYNISPTISNFAQGQTVPADLGVNSWGKMQYNGPCPPLHSTHHYIFTLYALDSRLNINLGINALDLKNKMQGHIIDEVSLTGIFGQ